MIKLGYCDKCKHKTGFSKGHPLCEAFPNGIPYEHMEKPLELLKDCNKGISFEPKSNNESLTNEV